MSIYKYKVLMEGFLNNDIIVEEFEREYLYIFKNETEVMQDAVF